MDLREMFLRIYIIMEDIANCFAQRFFDERKSDLASLRDNQERMAPKFDKRKKRNLKLFDQEQHRGKYYDGT